MFPGPSGVIDVRPEQTSPSAVVTLDHQYSHSTPESIRPYPRAGPRTQKTGGRKKGKSAIITDTPEKNALAAAKKAKSVPRKHVAKAKRTLSGVLKNSNLNSKEGKAPAPKPKEKVKEKVKNTDKITFCLICHESFDDNWVQCLECNNWAHTDCTDGNDYYVCHNCEDD